MIEHIHSYTSLTQDHADVLSLSTITPRAVTLLALPREGESKQSKKPSSSSTNESSAMEIEAVAEAELGLNVTI